MNIVILAAGQGRRMASPRPKLLHRLGGRSLLEHVLATARALAPQRLVVVFGHAGDQLRAACQGGDLHWVEQSQQQGTGHAVQQALPALTDAPLTLIMNGDVPLISASTLERLLERAGPDQLALLTVELDDATGYGRVLRNERGQIRAIVEHKDANAVERGVREINTGIMVVPTAHLAAWLPRLTNHNAQKEYYLTDIFALAVADGVAIESVDAASVDETLGVNSQEQLAVLERVYQRGMARVQLEAGVMLADIDRFDQRGTLTCGLQVEIDINCIFEGDVVLGNRVRIGAHCLLKDVQVDDDVQIEPYSHIVGTTIGAGARIGPYARLRPGTALGTAVHIGNFVEVKNSVIGASSKANHLSYLGDASIGRDVNVGAGTITCNYDGANKHRTVIEDDVQIGSDVQLVAPVAVGTGATIGAGTTVWKDVPAASLVVNPKTQLAKPGWPRPKKN